MGVPLLTLACLAYLSGLLLSRSPFLSPPLNFWGPTIILWSSLTAIALVGVYPFWRRGPNRQQWLILGLIGLLASGYSFIRIPQPSGMDMSRWVTPPATSPQPVIVDGTLMRGGRKNQQGKQQFWLRVQQAQKPPAPQFRPMTGKIYLTLPPHNPLWQRCQHLRVTGTLYQPSPPSNPHSFNFADYLYQRGIFAGLSGKQATLLGQGFCGLAPVRQHIVERQSAWLPGIGESNWPGLLLSSIVMGQNAVNLPPALRTLFHQVGLSHFLAASGFQVSLLMGTILTLGQRWSPQWAVGLGLGTLLFYVGLTGTEPSVIRACLMWVGVMVALLNEQKLNTLGALLLVATGMLLVNPGWIWQLGFQLSFLATFGIVVTAAPLQKKLGFLPGRLAEIIAVPVAATLWTTPILLYQFGYLIPAALPLNILVSPLIELLSFGGMVSAGLCLLFPPLGSGSAWLMAFPTQWLINIAEQFQRWPTVAVGQVGVWQVIALYFGLILMWRSPIWRQQWRWLCFVMVGMVVVPLGIMLQTRIQLTIFDLDETLVVVAQQPEKTTVIRPVSKNINYVLEPFLAKQGINQITCDIRFNLRQPTVTLPTDCQHIHPISQSPLILELNFAQHRWWLFVQTPTLKQPPPRLPVADRPDTLLWAGQFFPFPWLSGLRPPTAIAITPYVNNRLEEAIRKNQGDLWVTGNVGAVQWTPRTGFFSALESAATDIR